MTFKRATPLNTPNVLDDNIAPKPPPPPEKIRFTIRIPEALVPRLKAELKDRMVLYRQRRTPIEPTVTKTLSMTPGMHEWLAQEAEYRGLTINKLITLMLEDPALDPANVRYQDPRQFGIGTVQFQDPGTQEWSEKHSVSIPSINLNSNPPSQIQKGLIEAAKEAEERKARLNTPEGRKNLAALQELIDEGFIKVENQSARATMWFKDDSV